MKNWFGYQRKLVYKNKIPQKDILNKIQTEKETPVSENNTINLCLPQNQMIPARATPNYFQNFGGNYLYLMMQNNIIGNEFGWKPLMNYSYF